MFLLYYLLLVPLAPLFSRHGSLHHQSLGLTIASAIPNTSERGPEREVSLLQRIYLHGSNIARHGDRQGHMLFPIDESLFYAGTDKDPPLEVQFLINNINEVVPNVIIYEDEGKKIIGDNPDEDFIRRSIPLGSSILTNKALWDPERKATQCQSPPNPRNIANQQSGLAIMPSIAQACYNVLKNGKNLDPRLLAHKVFTYLDTTLILYPGGTRLMEYSFSQSRAYDDAFELWKSWKHPFINYAIETRVKGGSQHDRSYYFKFRSKIEARETSEESTTRESDKLADGKKPKTAIGKESEPRKSKFTEEFDINGPESFSKLLRKEEMEVARNKKTAEEAEAAEKKGLPAAPKTGEIPPTEAKEKSPSKDSGLPEEEAPSTDPSKKSVTGLTTKIKGEIKTVVARVSRDLSLKIGGRAAVGVGTVLFIIVDIINGQFHLDIATISGIAAVGVQAVTLFLVPIIGLAADLVYFLIAALLEGMDGRTLPPGDDPLKVIRFSFFGDMDTTGDEQCQKGTEDSDVAAFPPSKDCKVLYAAAPLARGLKLSNYDATILSIWANDGYPITLPELAKKLCVIYKDGGH